MLGPSKKTMLPKLRQKNLFFIAEGRRSASSLADGVVGRSEGASAGQRRPVHNHRSLQTCGNVHHRSTDGKPS